MDRKRLAQLPFQTYIEYIQYQVLWSDDNSSPFNNIWNLQQLQNDLFIHGRPEYSQSANSFYFQNSKYLSNKLNSSKIFVSNFYNTVRPNLENSNWRIQCWSSGKKTIKWPIKNHWIHYWPSTWKQNQKESTGSNSLTAKSVSGLIIFLTSDREFRISYLLVSDIFVLNLER